MKFIVKFVVIYLLLQSFNCDKLNNDTSYEDYFIQSSRSITIKDKLVEKYPASNYTLRLKKSPRDQKNYLIPRIIEPLEPCTEYEIFLKERQKQNLKIFNIRIKTLAEPPGIVRNINYDYNQKTKSLNITWDKPENATQCVINYLVNITLNEDLSRTPILYEANNLYYSFEDVQQGNYTVHIWARGEENNGSITSKNIICLNLQDNNLINTSEYLDNSKLSTYSSSSTTITAENTAKSSKSTGSEQNEIKTTNEIITSTDSLVPNEAIKATTNILLTKLLTSNVIQENSATEKTISIQNTSIDTDLEQPKVPDDNMVRYAEAKPVETENTYKYRDKFETKQDSAILQTSSTLDEIPITKATSTIDGIPKPTIEIPKQATSEIIKSTDSMVPNKATRATTNMLSTKPLARNVIHKNSATKETTTTISIQNTSMDTDLEQPKVPDDNMVRYADAKPVETENTYKYRDKFETKQDSAILQTSSTLDEIPITKATSTIDGIPKPTIEIPKQATSEIIKSKDSMVPNEATKATTNMLSTKPLAGNVIHKNSATKETTTTISIQNTSIDTDLEQPKVPDDNNKPEIQYAGAKPVETENTNKHRDNFETKEDSAILQTSSTLNKIPITEATISTIDLTPTPITKLPIIKIPKCTTSPKIYVSNKSTDSLLLYWDTPENCNPFSYKIEYRNEKIIIRNAYYEMKNLDPCEEYNITVEPLDKDNNSIGDKNNIKSTTYPSTTEFDFNVKSNENSLELQWNPPDNCNIAFNFIISVDGSEKNTKENSFTVNNLQPCEKYSVSVRAEFEKWRTKDAQKEVVTIPKSKTVSDIKIVPNITFMDVSWSPPDNCLLFSFKYTIGYDETSKIETEDMTYRFDQLTQCTNYNISITPEISDKTLHTSFKGSVASQDTFTTINKDDFEFNVTSNEDSIELFWDPPGNCNVPFKYIILVNGDQNDTNDNEFKKDELVPCTKYLVSVRPEFDNWNIEERKKEVVTMPKSRTVSNIKITPKSTSMEVTWEPADNCMLLNFTYIIEYVDNYNIGKETDETNITLDQLKQCTNYNISITPKINEEAFVSNFEGDLAYQDKYTTANENAQVSDIIITPSENKMNVRWTPSDENCDFSYKVSYTSLLGDNWTTFADKWTATNINIENLDPCVNYTVQITPIFGEIYYKTNEKSSTTLVAVPGPVTKLTQNSTDIRDNSTFDLNVDWDQPSVNGTCTDHYRYIYMADNIEIYQTDTYRPSINMYNLKLCVHYEVFVIPLTPGIQTLWGEKSSTKHFNSKENDPPVIVKYPEEPCNPCETIWQFKDNNCKVKQINITCSTNPQSGVHNECIQEQIQELFDIPVDFDYGKNASFNLTNLSSYANYTCSGILVNEAGVSKPSDNFSITTKEAVPDPPRNLTIDDFNISWLAPECFHGQFLNYNVTVEYKGPTYNTRDDCPKDVYYNHTYSTSEISFTYKEVRYSSNYDIYVSAITNAGLGVPIISPYTSKISAPDAPTDVKHSIIWPKQTDRYDASINLRWSSPCVKNGPIKYYTLEDGKNVIQKTEAGADDSFDVTSYLLAEKTYKIKIYANNGEKGIGSEVVEFDSPSGVPDIDANEEILFGDMNNMTIKNLTFNSSMFIKNNGQLKYFALILARTNSCLPIYGYYDNKNWPTDNKCGTQITPEFWEPSFAENEGRTTFTIGDGECSISNSSIYCNDPLKPNTTYYLKVRGFTKNGWRDSKYYAFITKPLLLAQQGSPDIGLISGLIVGVFGMTIIIVVVYKTRGRLSYFKNWQLRSEVLTNTDSPTPQAVSIKKFIPHYKIMMENSGKIKSEFTLLQNLCQDVTLSTKEALLPINRRKNRYINILPYDETRVKLQVQNMSDYINASYIKGYSNNNEYIATQGPTEMTCAAFWQMIYDENVKIVVMLTQFLEGGKEKCYQYFPKVNEESYIESNDMKIQCLEMNHHEIYTQRKLVAIKNKRKKDIIHLLFNKWPDFGVPNKVSHILSFCETMTQLKKKNTGLVVVHCSAGVGRTGTLIALDILSQAIKDKQKIDIFGTVFNLRKQRMIMVQSERQYEFLYKCVQEIILRKGGSSSICELNNIEESDM